MGEFVGRATGMEHYLETLFGSSQRQLRYIEWKGEKIKIFNSYFHLDFWTTASIEVHRVEASKKFMIFKNLHFPPFSSFILQG